MDKKKSKLYGLLAKFHEPETLIRASHRVVEAGYRRFDAYTPYPVEGLAQSMRLRSSPLPFFVFAGGLMGALGGYLLQFYGTVIDYPMNIGGKPVHSWPTYIPVTFELTVLLAAFAGVIGLFLFTRFPEPYHPVFNVEDFQKHGSQDGFYLGIEARDPKFDLEGTRKFLEDLGSHQVFEVEA